MSFCFDKSIFAGLTSKYHIHLQVQGYRWYQLAWSEWSSNHRSIDLCLVWNECFALCNSPFVLQQQAVKSHYICNNRIESSESKDVKGKSWSSKKLNGMGPQICGRARGSKALVPLASLSRALLKRLKAQPRAVRWELRRMLAIGESDIAFHLRYIISFQGWVE